MYIIYTIHGIYHSLQIFKKLLNFFYFILGSTLKSLVRFDREERKSYFVPIAITDSGNPSLTGTSTLHVVIGDVNDNPMKSGYSEIFVYNYKVGY